MALHTDLPIHKTGCQLLALAINVQTQMPRTVKRQLGNKITEHCIEMLDLMAMTAAIIQLRPYFLRKPQAAAYLGLSETTFDRLVAEGKIAKPYKISDGCSAWRLTDLDAYAVSCQVSDLLPPSNTQKRKTKTA